MPPAMRKRSVPAIRDSGARTQVPPNSRHQLGGVERLLHEVDGAPVQRLHPRRHLVHGREHDDRWTRAQLSVMSARTWRPLHPGHHQVEQDQVDVVLAEMFQGALAVLGRGDRVALGHQEPHQETDDPGFVVDDQQIAHVIPPWI